MFQSLAHMRLGLIRALEDHPGHLPAQYLDRLNELDFSKRPVELDGLKETLLDNYQSVNTTIIKSYKLLEAALSKVEDQMDTTASAENLISRRYWEDRMRCNYAFYKESRVVPVDLKELQLVRQSIINNVPTFVPVLCLGPSPDHYSFVEIVATTGNIFYGAHFYQQALDDVRAMFPEPHQHKLRMYSVGSEDNEIGLHSILPSEKFGFIFSWNLFNYFSKAVAHEWINQASLLLRQGGKFMFLYNNAYDPVNAEWLDRGKTTYMTPKIIRDIASKNALQVHEFGSDQHYHWAILKKAGGIDCRLESHERGLIKDKKPVDRSK